ncbi:hypothetical protein GGI10_001989 [Coemansia sp. RSA 2530]|uniref:Kinase-like domain-containing protein n=1 Tax=Coemansia spiralis TaxID=417178 RepID=A0A9W8GRY6_9FUNG|nr:hypothetical protein GGI06_003253 [Coemansia sp. S85]KAJ2415020.1 hypothetical protein GGI10_001989 [Coemansia sp. RSA 2530]KAJ2690922.1 hypothetical protein IWW39_000431 [Coemansia spiralis]
MTGLSLQQSELEVSQQRNLKRMIRRIRASRRPPHHHVGASPRTPVKHASLRKPTMPSLSLPAPELNRAPPEDDSQEWSDDSTLDDSLSLRKMDIVMDIADSPSPTELSARVARLFNSVFEPSPSIEPEHVSVSRLSGAMTNCVFMVTVTPAPHVPTTAAVTAVLRSTAVTQGDCVQLPVKYLLRVYGTGVDEFLSREKELYWLSQLTSLGFGPRLYGIFGNGRLEEFLESTTLTKSDIRDPSTSKHIARRMCELHSLVSYYRPFGGPNTRAVDLSGAPELWTNVESWLRLVEKKWSRIRTVCADNPLCMGLLDNWPRLEQAVAKLRLVIARANSPVVFAHDDLQYGNILRLENTGELVVVDFEYAGYNYRGFDIANHFCEWMADYHHEHRPHVLGEDAYPTLAQRRGFLRTYVKAKAFLDANMKADKGVVENDKDLVKLRWVTLGEERIKAEIDYLEKEVTPFVPASHLHWGVWGLLQACSSDIEFDYVAYAAQRLSIFLRMVEQF